MLDGLTDDVGAAEQRMERLAKHVRAPGFDNWEIFPAPGVGRSLVDALEAGCQCGGALQVVEPFQTLAEQVLIGFLKEEDRAQLKGIVELHCGDCGYVGSAQR